MCNMVVISDPSICLTTLGMDTVKCIFVISQALQIITAQTSWYCGWPWAVHITIWQDMNNIDFPYHKLNGECKRLVF
jgi:hypothetical protein